jgi:hypothetical protein
MNVFADITYLKRGRIMTPQEIDSLEGEFAGTVAAVIGDVSAEVSSVLIKRYGQYPDFPDCPVALSSCVAAIVIQRLWETHGASPTNTDKTPQISTAADKAWARIREAADSQNGLVEFSISATDQSSGVTKSGPRSYTEQSPYGWTTAQSQAGREEDANR